MGAPAMAKIKEPEVVNPHESIKALAETIQVTMRTMEAIDKDDIPATLRSYKTLTEFLEELEELVDALSKFKTTLSYETIPQMFERAGVDSVKLSGRNFIVGVRFNASIPNDKKQAGFKWLEENGLGALIQPNVNPKTLSSAIASFFESTAMLPPSEAVSVHKQTYTSVRKV